MILDAVNAKPTAIESCLLSKGKSLLVGVMIFLTGCGADTSENSAAAEAKLAQQQMDNKEFVVRCIEATGNIDKCKDTFSHATDISVVKAENGESVLQYVDEQGKLTQITESQGSWADALLPMAAGAMMGAAASSFFDKKTKTQTANTHNNPMPSSTNSNTSAVNKAASSSSSSNQLSSTSSQPAKKTVASLANSNDSSSSQSGSTKTKSSTSNTSTGVLSLPSQKRVRKISAKKRRR